MNIHLHSKQYSWITSGPFKVQTCRINPHVKRDATLLLFFLFCKIHTALKPPYLPSSPLPHSITSKKEENKYKTLQFTKSSATCANLLHSTSLVMHLDIVALTH